MTRILHRKWFVPILLWAVGGCSWGVHESNGEIPEMHRNLSRTVDIQTGVIHGDLGKAQAAAEWLLSRQDQISFPTSGGEYRDEMLEYAYRISTATELEVVATQTGRLAGACGRCHQATGGGPTFMVGTKSPTGDSQESQMIRHLWAADRMWEGLVGPSEEAWMAGAEAMAESQPGLARELRASGNSQRSERLLEEVNLLAQEALTKSDLAARADVYGRLLDTCYRCHTLSGTQVTKSLSTDRQAPSSTPARRTTDRHSEHPASSP
jgi:cytochrome c553